MVTCKDDAGGGVRVSGPGSAFLETNPPERKRVPAKLHSLPDRDRTGAFAVEKPTDREG
jgi:hypothetical protein